MNILQQLQEQAEHNKEVDKVVKFAKSGELEKLHKTQQESSGEVISQEEMSKVLEDVSCVK